ncbi:unnamed protein product [Arabidopsis lyrata]|uniref:Predicted protein n=1 Tax=Arabidopsis lyrata subsp. lyrata TaxID=81972 RepID=D7L7J4_ARALL|nr:uncharacterized protein LOC9322112 [Arabidopsis lyrata subsp. lyrata]EFH62305.1 predicted protein [Arabidopsis lyrata subsp. lyrata]CAH8262734.1 unnamed protein product [Arabidopsis lyrata]|eukprot:XP_002886046.1 uncharacterized protein LOC9322112 [Arabidopsis lyrata subsp. lyrata]
MIDRIMTNLIVLYILVILAMIVTGSESSNTRDAEINRLMKKLNKPFLKSIKSPDGDIIDCVHMKNHPIYDHPLFKNHTIQMRPTSYPEGWSNKDSDNEKHNMVPQLWTINGKCPKNSIPIRRTRKEDILRAKSIERFGKKDPNNIHQHKRPTNPTNDGVHEYAILKVEVNSPRAMFYGTQTFINVWKPYVQHTKEFSLAQIWMSAGSYSTQLETIEAGWQVLTALYNDTNPRYFVYWTNDSYIQHGCYNTICPGFVVVNQAFALGAAVPEVSIRDGLQYEIFTSIWKDRSSGNWWLRFGTHVIVGYWPSLLFNRLRIGATEVEWGGEIVNLKENNQHTSTQMGSGSFAINGYRKASYFRNIFVTDENNITRQPVGPSTFVSEESCYDIRYRTEQAWGSFFYYGGPGRSPFCN